MCLLPREGEPTVLREAEEVLPLVVDEVRDALYQVEMVFSEACWSSELGGPRRASFRSSFYQF